jgi:CheY-like chemotaxis protein
MHPTALLVYEALLPGSQLVNRLRELGYRVQCLNSTADLTESARQEKPLIILADLVWKKADMAGAIAALRADPETEHVPILAFCPLKEKKLHQAAQKAGATLVAASDGLLDQLEVLLAQALEVE